MDRRAGLGQGNHLLSVAILACLSGFVKVRLIRPGKPGSPSLSHSQTMSTRFKFYPSRTLGDWKKCRWSGEVIHPITGKKILCFICRQKIKVENAVEREFIRPSGKRRKKICDQPYAVYHKKRFVLQHVNCTPDSHFNEEYTDSESYHEEKRERNKAFPDEGCPHTTCANSA